MFLYYEFLYTELWKEIKFVIGIKILDNGNNYELRLNCIKI